MTNVVPEYWECAPRSPAIPARPIGVLLFLPALVGQLVLPRRLGPRLACTSIFVALLVHIVPLLLWTAFVLLVFESAGPDLVTEDLTGLSLGEQIRLPLVIAVEKAHVLVSRGDVLPVVIPPLCGHALCWLLAWGLLPLVASASKRRRAFGRALKLVLWSSLAIVPCAAGVLALIVLVREMPDSGFDEDLLVVLAAVASAVYWLHLLLWLGSRVHWLDQDGDERRPACCDGCGYRLTGLPTDGRCPECGLEVAASLPGTRQPPAWATARGLGRRLLAFPGTSWRILRQPHFFRTLVVYDGQEQVVRFAMRVCWLAALWVLLVVAGPVWYDIRSDSDVGESWFELVFVLGMLTLLPLLLTMIGGGCVALLACRFGLRDPRPTTVVTAYATVLLLPMWVLLPLSFLAIAGLHGLTPWGKWVDHLPTGRMLLAEGTMLVAVFTPPMLGLAFAIRRYLRALRDIRHAAA
ncbi:MAG: hypothetical protein PVJ57_10845 [Phycisphaerae bacterium]